MAQAHAELAREAKAAGRKVAIISGGELSVTVRNAKGRGGRNQEYALALAIALDGLPGIAALAADTDGIDGGDGQADGSRRRHHRCGNARRARATWMPRSSSTITTRRASSRPPAGSIVRGPTHTNVNDFRVILVDA